jgi:hypothetical protein
MCRFFLSKQGCKRGSKCNYAHDVSEQRSGPDIQRFLLDHFPHQKERDEGDRLYKCAFNLVTPHPPADRRCSPAFQTSSASSFTRPSAAATDQTAPLLTASMSSTRAWPSAAVRLRCLTPVLQTSLTLLVLHRSHALQVRRHGDGLLGRRLPLPPPLPVC